MHFTYENPSLYLSCESSTQLVDTNQKSAVGYKLFQRWSVPCQPCVVLQNPKADVNQDVTASWLFSWVIKPGASYEHTIALITFWNLGNIPTFLGSDHGALISTGSSYRGECVAACPQQMAGILGSRKLPGKGDKMPIYSSH